MVNIFLGQINFWEKKLFSVQNKILFQNKFIVKKNFRGQKNFGGKKKIWVEIVLRSNWGCDNFVRKIGLILRLLG